LRAAKGGEVTDRSVLSRADAGALAHAGVDLGLARAAIDAFIEIANRREITIAALGGQRVLLRLPLRLK
jgi:hypothetical protein